MCVMACINYFNTNFALFTSYRLDKNTTCPQTARSYRWNSQVTHTRTELVSMWTATIGIQANSCLLEPIYRYSDSYSYQCECTLKQCYSAWSLLYLSWIPSTLNDNGGKYCKFTGPQNNYFCQEQLTIRPHRDTLSLCGDRNVLLYYCVYVY